MSKNFENAMENAIKKEFSWLDKFENPYLEYKFSQNFEYNMRKIIPKAEFTYVSVGNKRIRKTLLVAIIALMAVIITGCVATVHYVVTWNESQNDEQGTLDVTFEVNAENNSKVDNVSIPETPAGYTITEQSKDDIFCDISYEDSKNNQIIFSACKSIETMGLSIDNEDADFKETTINGYKGYTYYKDGLSAIFWTDSAYFYTLQGTCDMSILLKMTESMVE